MKLQILTSNLSSDVDLNCRSLSSNLSTDVESISSLALCSLPLPTGTTSSPPNGLRAAHCSQSAAPTLPSDTLLCSQSAAPNYTAFRQKRKASVLVGEDLAADVALQTRQAAASPIIAFSSLASSLHIPPAPHCPPEHAVPARFNFNTFLIQF